MGQDKTKWKLNYMLFILFLGHINTRKLPFIVPERISSDSVSHQIEPSHTRWGTVETHFWTH